MALTDNIPTRYIRNPELMKTRVGNIPAATTIFKGAEVGMDTAVGLYKPMAPTYRFAGIARDGLGPFTAATTDNSLILEYGHTELLNITTTQANTGRGIVATDDNTNAIIATNDDQINKVGTINEIYSSTQAWVDITGPTGFN